MNTSFFGEMLQTIAERGRALLDRTRDRRERRAEDLLVRKAAGLRVGGQIVRDRRAAPVSEVPPDGGLLGAGGIGGYARRPVVFQLCPGPGHQPRVLPV